MQSLKSKIILNLLLHSHLFRFRLRRSPFDATPAGILKFRKQTETASDRFGKVPAGITIENMTITDNLSAEWIKSPKNHAGKVLLYFHGGFYMIGSSRSHRQHVVKFVRGCRINALVPDYRLAPEHPFPAAFEDALAAFRYLFDQGFSASDIVVAGDSAGGGLALAMLLALKDQAIALPAAAALLSPWTDLLLTGKSHQYNRKKCFSPEGCPENASRLYAAGHDLSDPYLSPLYGDLAGLPPLHISAGGNETLLDDSLMFAERAKAAGVEVALRIDKGMCHCYPVFGDLFRESAEALADICNHLKKHAGVN